MPEIVSQTVGKHPAPVVSIKLPAAFHVLTGGRRQLPVEGETVREVLAALERACPGVQDRLMDQDGSVKRYVNVYRNDSDIRCLDDLETKVADDDIIWIVPAVAGGSGAARVREA
ncbi:ubiquitin-like small modifier protein 1 [Streptomyces sp. NPDC058371]|uniref:ubiquitin-like small modifier protein 1 n=1 Tax=Streptomyces sp. NPDC058371 TaxID=3346463 RepID=UPI0036693F30